jgi:hypothetical protein
MGMLYNETYLIPQRVTPTLELAAVWNAATAADVVQGPFTVLSGETLPLPFGRYSVVGDILLDGKRPPRGMRVGYRGAEHKKLAAELVVPHTEDRVVHCADLGLSVHDFLRDKRNAVLLYALAAPRVFELHLPDYDEDFNEVPGTASKRFTAQHLIVIFGTDSDGDVARRVGALRTVLSKVLGPLNRHFHILD